MVKEKHSLQVEFWDNAVKKHGTGLKTVSHPNSKKDTSIVDNYLDRAFKRAFLKAVDIHKDFSILDLGCGVGRWTLWLAPKVKKVTCVDISSEMINAVKKESERRGLCNVDTYTDSADEMAIPSNYYDLIIAVEVLKYIVREEDLVDSIKKMYNILKPSGKVIVIETTAKSPRFIFKNKDDFIFSNITNKNSTSGNLFGIERTPEEYITLFSKQKFQLVKHIGVYLPPYPLWTYRDSILPSRIGKYLLKFDKPIKKFCYLVSYYFLDLFALNLLKDKTQERLFVFQK